MTTNKKKRPSKNPYEVSSKQQTDYHIRLDNVLASDLQDIASIESTVLNRSITVSELIRFAVVFTYTDNERMRECFRRTRRLVKSKKRNVL